MILLALPLSKGFSVSAGKCLMGEKSAKKRLDLLLVEGGLAESRARAQWLIRQGLVHCDGQPCYQPGRRFPATASISLLDTLPYVSRGGLKLAHALDTFGLVVEGLVALDVGASTGGFSDCLLQRGVGQVYAVDVGTGQLHPRLRRDTRVISREQTDIRDLEELPGKVLVDLIVVDVSFISLRLVLPTLLRFLRPSGQMVVLIKPQFEAGPEAVSRGGMVRRPQDRRRALEEVLGFARELGLVLGGLCQAPPDPPRANIEYLACLRLAGPGVPLEWKFEH